MRDRICSICLQDISRSFQEPLLSSRGKKRFLQTALPQMPFPGQHRTTHACSPARATVGSPGEKMGRRGRRPLRSTNRLFCRRGWRPRQPDVGLLPGQRRVVLTSSVSTRFLAGSIAHSLRCSSSQNQSGCFDFGKEDGGSGCIAFTALTVTVEAVRNELRLTPRRVLSFRQDEKKEWGRIVQFMSCEQIILSPNKNCKIFPAEFVPYCVAFLDHISPLCSAEGALSGANSAWKSNCTFYQGIV